MAADYEDLWSSKEKKVKNGEVSFKVPTDRTAGLSIGISPPWEVAVPYETIVALRYKGYAPGAKMSYSDINTAKWASGCWAGTTADAATLKVVVKKVTVMGNMGPVKGSIAFAKTTQDYLQPIAAHLGRRAGRAGRLRLRPRGRALRTGDWRPLPGLKGHLVRG